MNKFHSYLEAVQSQRLDIDKILKAYLITALWVSVDEDDEPLDRYYTSTDYSRDAIRKAKEDIIKFVKDAGELLNGEDEDEIGHNLYLSRTGHGAGFWDHDPYQNDKESLFKTTGDQLTKLAENLGSVVAYVGDDGKIHFE